MSESIAGLLQRPGRTILTALGVLLGVGAFVAVLGVTTTGNGQISKRFTAQVATQVTVEEIPDPDGLRQASLFPDDSETRVKALNGVVQAGLLVTVPAGSITTVSGVELPGSHQDDYMPIIAATPGAFGAVHATVLGRTFDDFHQARAEHVAVLGAAAARQLGIVRIDVAPAILINGTPLTVIGIMADVRRRPDLLSAVLVPSHTAASLWGNDIDPGQPPQMLIETNLGAGQLIASQAAVALRPDYPNGFKTTAPPDPRKLRDRVASDLSKLFVILAGVCLVIGAVGIANTTVIAVLERVHEIGLRRALGARPQHIALQFLTESTFLGTFGGLVGTGLGTACVVLLAVTQQWTPIMEPALVLPAPLLGSAIGLLAGVYPAVRAANIEPDDAIRI